MAPDLISSITSEVLEEITAWQQRPLESCYPVVFFDALRVKIRDEGVVRTKAVYLALGITRNGTKAASRSGRWRGRGGGPSPRRGAASGHRRRPRAHRGARGGGARPAARAIWRQLREEGMLLGFSSVCRVLARVRATPHADVLVRFEGVTEEFAQVDFGEVSVRLIDGTHYGCTSPPTGSSTRAGCTWCSSPANERVEALISQGGNGAAMRAAPLVTHRDPRCAPGPVAVAMSVCGCVPVRQGGEHCM